MRRPPAALAAALLAVALSTLSACSAKAKFIPPGNYSGSDAAHHRFTLDVTRGGVKVNRAKARFVGPGRIRFGQADLTCEPRDEGEEVHCVVRWPDRTETIDLMRL